MAKIYNYQKVRKDAIYNIKMICDEIGPSKSTVKYWAHNNGLEPIDINDRPWLFEGHVLKEFLKIKKDKFKVKLKPGEFYCLSCRKGVRVLAESIILEYTGKKLGKGGVAQILIRGVCSECGKNATRLTSYNRVDEFLKFYPEYKKTIKTD